ncbi:MAG: aldo/keto reductase [Alphaproteobacteria bacterium]
MEKRTFGKTGFEVTALGFGGGPVGFLGTEQASVATILNLLLDRGINLIDTAAAYQGSEAAIGAAVASRRDEFVLVSKCGQKFDDIGGEAWTAETVTKTVDRALKRLKTNHLDVMLLHSCDLDTLKKGEALGALIEAREAGKVRHVGYSGDNEAAAYAVTVPDIAVLETSVNICDQVNIDKVLPGAQQNGVGVLAKRPIANAAWKDVGEQQGVYANYSRTYAGRLAHMGLTPEALGFGGDAGAAWTEIALRFTLTQPGVTTAIVGSTNPAHVGRNLQIAEKGPLPAATMERLREAFRNAEQASGETWPGQT